MGQSHPSIAMPKTRAHRRPEHGTCGRADADATQERRAFARSHQHSSPALAASEVSNGRHTHSSRPRTGPQRAPNRAMPFRLRGSWALEGPTPQPSASGPTYCRFQYSNSMRNQTNASPRHTPINACLSGAGLDSSQERPYENTSDDLPGHTPEPACSVRDSWSWVPTAWAHVGSRTRTKNRARAARAARAAEGSVRDLDNAASGERECQGSVGCS